jgi:DNA repair protein RecN (Recombination protein N)
MLTALSIRDIVLVDALDLEVHGGLTVLTGETGAGKSIILDALGLALGARADAGLVRAGAKQASATAVFTAPDDPALIALISERGFDVVPGEELILRRTLAADGRSRAFVNDQPAGVTALREIGQALVEVHGENGLGIHGVGRADEGFEHALVGVFARAFGKLDNKGRLAVYAALEETEGLLHVVDVVSSNGIFAVGDFEQLCGRDDHGKRSSKPRI